MYVYIQKYTNKNQNKRELYKLQTYIGNVSNQYIKLYKKNYKKKNI